ncbi:MAG: ABC transporter permease, partial [Actinomycetota bacterium]|nr:ABC transporter permease [Actinomycetota bacterium]
MLTRVRAVAAKEFWALVRQPQLLILLLVGPVLIMAAFALSFSTDWSKPSVVVVVRPESEGAELFERFRPRFVSHIDFQGTVDSVETADRLIKSGEVDGAIIVPSDPSAAIVNDERAVIGVHYSAINPLHGLKVPNRARGILFDLNDALVQEGIARRMDDLRSAQERVAELDHQLGMARDATETLTSEETRETLAELDASLSVLESSLEIVQATGPEQPGSDVPETLQQVREARETVSRVQEAQEEGGAEQASLQGRLSELDRQLDAIQERLTTVPNVSPSVLANPFRLTIENLAPFQPGVAGFYAPGVLAILIQHIAVSLASLAIIRERLSGAYEFFEVSPLGPGQLLAGKFFTYLALVLGVNAAVVAAMVGFLDIPFNGGFASLSVAMVLLTVASLGLGFVISALAKSQLQAIQVAMLLLIGSGFFAGFLFPLSQMGQPAH